MSENSGQCDFNKLVADLAAAEKAMLDAAAEESNARNRLTAVLDNLNRAQRAFDQAVEQRKKAAPRDSDWATNQQRPNRKIMEQHP